MNSSPYFALLIGLLVFSCHEASSTRVIRRRVQVPVREKAAAVAEAMGAASYEESSEVEDSLASSSKRVQRKLATAPQEDVDQNQSDQFMEYQGVMGRPGVDFPVLPSIPRTQFSCRNVKSSGYYADLDTGCQVFHICDGGRKISFLCPNGTIFRQSHLICDWWFRVDCGRSVELYEESAEQLAHDQMLYKKRAEALAKAMQEEIKKDATEAPHNNRYNNRQESYQKKETPTQVIRNNGAYYDETYERKTVAASLQSRRQRPTTPLSTTTTEPPNYPPLAVTKNHLSQEPGERQIPAETASFATNSRHRFSNHFTQPQNYYPKSTTPQPSYNTPKYQFPEAIRPSTYHRPSFFTPSTSTTTTTTTTTTTQTPPSTYRSRQDYRTATSSTAKPIFTVRVKPSKAFSYVELHRQKDPEAAPLPTTTLRPSTAQPPVSIHVTERLPSSFPKIFTPFVPSTSTPRTLSSSTFGTTQKNAYLPGTTQHVVRIPANTEVPPTRDPKSFGGISPQVINALIELSTPKPVYNKSPVHPDPAGAKNLHSLASYYGTSVSNLVVGPLALSEASFYHSAAYYHRSPNHHNHNHNHYHYYCGPHYNYHPPYHHNYTPDNHYHNNPPDHYHHNRSPYNDLYYHYVPDDHNKVTHPPISEILLRTHSGSPDISTEVDETPMTTTVRTEVDTEPEELPSVLTKATKDSYSLLFSEKRQKEQKFQAAISSPSTEAVNPSISSGETTSKDVDNYFNREESGRVIPTTTENRVSAFGDNYSDDLRLKHSSDLRELAQVFSRALSAYLENPETFKEILAQVRPTEPNLKDNTTPSLEDEVLDFSDAAGSRIASTDIPSYPRKTNIDIRQINDLASQTDNVDLENSVEQTTTVTESNEDQTKLFTTTLKPTSLAMDINNIVYNKSHLDAGYFYSPPSESSEDNSYFPTAGGVDDNSRPRYGGFQNNTNKSSGYIPYGAEVSPNRTGSPVDRLYDDTSPRAQSLNDVSPSIVVEGETGQASNMKIPENLDVPEARDVNNLLGSNANSLFSPYSTASAEDKSSSTPSLLQKEQDYYGPSGDQEKLLIASGSQSIVSGDNYFNYVPKTGKSSSKYGVSFKSSPSSFGSYTAEALTQTTEMPSSETEAPTRESDESEDSSEGTENQMDTETPSTTSGYEHRTTVKEESTFATTETARVTALTTEEEDETDSRKPRLLEQYDSGDYDDNVTYQAINLGNGVTLERTVKVTLPAGKTAWTVQPTYAPSTTPFETTTKEEASSEQSSTDKSFRPTPFRLPQIHTTEPQEETETTVGQRTTVGETQYTTRILETTSAMKEEATTTPATDTTTVMTETMFEEKAKEMFGDLNETMAGALMDMMEKAESNMTIRRLVLLLVADMSKDNITPEETRSSLIQALLTTEDEDRGSTEVTSSEVTYTEPTTTAVTSTEPTTTLLTTTTTTRPFRRGKASRTKPANFYDTPNYRKSKFYRGTDSETAVYGSNDQSSPEITNRINAAKLFIPSSSSEKLPYDSDARAVELLKSLYNLAAKWG